MFSSNIIVEIGLLSHAVPCALNMTVCEAGYHWQNEEKERFLFGGVFRDFLQPNAVPMTYSEKGDSFCFL